MKKQSRLSTLSKFALNGICPYFTMFPLEFPLARLRREYSTKPILLDVFCGRGTSLYAARILGISAYGIDSSPIAVAIARAKLARTKVHHVLRLAQDLLSNCTNVQVPDSPFWRDAYHPETLRAICRIRHGLMGQSGARESDASVLLRATMMGALHGPIPKTAAATSYFSNQMPRTFAPKPAYSVRYWKKHRIKAPAVSVLDVIEKRATRALEHSLPSIGPTNHVVQGNSEEAAPYAYVPRNYNLVITSPPYYGLTTYLQDQWLRHWFLGGPSKISYGCRSGLDHSSPVKFAQSLANVWNNVGESEADSLKMIIRFGSIGSRAQDSLELLRQSLEHSHHSWRIQAVHKIGDANRGKRQANQMKVGSRALMEYDVTTVRQ